MTDRGDRPSRTAAAVAAFATLQLALGGCSPSAPSGYQGYGEGEYVYVASSVSGRLEHLQVSRGGTVASGTPLFTLDAEEEADMERQAAQQLNAALAQLQDLQSGKRPAELDVIRAQLAQAAAAEQRSALQLKRDEQQFSAGGISEQQLDDSRAAETSNAARVRELASQLESARLPARTDQIRAQSAQVAAARAALAQASWRRSQKTLSAGRAASVVDTLFREGEWVPAGSPVVKLLPPENVKVRFFVPEAVLGSIRPGQVVHLRCDGCRGPIEGTVTYIAPESEYTPPVIYSNETRAKLVFMVEARPRPQDAASLHPGQPVEVALP